MRAAGASQLWTLPLWSVAEGDLKKGDDHYLLSCRNQLLVVQPLILPLPGAEQPAGLSGGRKRRSCCRDLATVAPLYPWNI